MDLVLIEGVGKKDTIQKYLGKGYVVFPTMGHVRDLPEKTIGVDIENNYEPTYEIMPDKQKIQTEETGSDTGFFYFSLFASSSSMPLKIASFTFSASLSQEVFCANASPFARICASLSGCFK